MKLSNEESDILRELINIGVGKAAGVLNQMTGMHIRMFVPDLRILSIDEMQKEQTEDDKSILSAVYLDFEGEFSGAAGLVFPSQGASQLVSLLTGEEIIDEDLDELKVGTLTEIGNIVVNGVMGSIGNVLNQQLMYSTPSYMENTLPNLMTFNVPDSRALVLMAQTRFDIEEKNIEGEIILTFGVGSFDVLLDIINKTLT